MMLHEALQVFDAGYRLVDGVIFELLLEGGDDVAGDVLWHKTSICLVMVVVGEIGNG
jgi:hypothetical protein